MNDLNSGSSRPDDVGPTITSKVGVLGSGLMGHGITYVTALAGMDVIMTDATQENADKGLARIKSILEDGLKRGLVTPEKIDQTLDRITPTDNYRKLDSCDLIIEAVFEDRELKSKVTGQAESFMDSNGIFASNTSTIPITSLAKKSSRPERFIGMHFFSPVHKMKLVEIIKMHSGNGTKMIGYGASARSSTLLNFCVIDHRPLICVADGNPIKHGKFTAGTDIPIVSPDEAFAKNPDTVLLLGWNFKDEILKIMKDQYQFHGKVILPLPNDPQIIEL